MLAESGQEVFYVTSPAEGTSRIPANVWCLEAPLMRWRFLPSNLPVDLWGYRSALKLLSIHRPDVVHIVAKGLFSGVAAACARLGIPTAFTVVDQYLVCPKENLRQRDGTTCGTFHGIYCGGCMRYDSGKSLLRALGAVGAGYAASLVRARYVDRLARRLSAIVTLSDTSRKGLVRYGLDPERIHTVYHYRIDVDESVAERRFPEPSILYAGTLTEERGPQVAIQSMAHVVDKVPGAVLRIAGPDTPERPFRPHLEKLVADLGLSDNVLFLGGKPNSDVMGLIQRSDAVIVPLQWPNEYGPVILLEAKYLGKPVVASRIGATPEFIDDGRDGFLVPHDKPELFGERLAHLLRNPDVARRVGQRAAEATGFLRGSAMAERMIDLYHGIV